MLFKLVTIILVCVKLAIILFAILHKVHTAMVLPFDMEMVLGTEVKRRRGILLPKLLAVIPKLRIAIDPKQLHVLKDILHEVAVSRKRIESLTRVSYIFTASKRALPLLRDSAGLHILPQLTLHLPGELVLRKYPIDCNLASFRFKRRKGDSMSSLVCYLKETFAGGWAKRMWTHVVNLIRADLRSLKPLSRWLDLGRLLYIRKQYAYMYSLYLRKSKSTGKIVYYPGARVHYTVASKIFEFEMILPVATVVAFREVAFLVVINELLKNKIRSMRSQGELCCVSVLWGLSTPPTGSLNPILRVF